MGLTIYYTMTTSLTRPEQVAKLVGAMRSFALDLPLQEVSEVMELSGAGEGTNQADPPDLRWLRIQATEFVAGQMVEPRHAIGFRTLPGQGCESANFGFGTLPDRRRAEAGERTEAENRHQTQGLAVEFVLQDPVRKRPPVRRDRAFPPLPPVGGENARLRPGDRTGDGRSPGRRRLLGNPESGAAGQRSWAVERNGGRNRQPAAAAVGGTRDRGRGSHPVSGLRAPGGQRAGKAGGAPEVFGGITPQGGLGRIPTGTGAWLFFYGCCHDERSLEDRLQDLCQGVVDNAVAVGGGVNCRGLGLQRLPLPRVAHLDQRFQQVVQVSFDALAEDEAVIAGKPAGVVARPKNQVVGFRDRQSTLAPGSIEDLLAAGHEPSHKA